MLMLETLSCLAVCWTSRCAWCCGLFEPPRFPRAEAVCPQILIGRWQLATCLGTPLAMMSGSPMRDRSASSDKKSDD